MSFDIAMNLILPPRDGKKPHITAPFGEKRASGPHKGVDFNYIGGQTGVNMQHPAAFSPVDGTISYSGGLFGTVKILDNKGFSHEILHLQSQNVKEGESVKAGITPIGRMGGRGPQKENQYAMHIHYQIKDSSGKIVNPQEWWANKGATSNSNPIDVKPIASPCLPIAQADGKEFKDAKSLASLLGTEANYLLGLNTWHGGIHISNKKVPWVKDIHPVRCMADGEVVAFRMMPDYLVSNFKGQEYRYSNSFCLVRHHFKQPKSAEENKGSTQKENSSEKGGGTEDNGFTYYTLYMHLCPWDKWPKNSRYRLKKGWRVRHSVPNHDYQPPALTLKAGEEFELVEGVTAQRGYVTGQGEFEFARIKVLSNGASSKEVLATKGMDSLWMAQDPSAIEKVGNIVRPMWVYDKIEARVKEDMVGRADPKAQKGKTGHYVAGDSVFSVPAGSLISFDAHRCEWQEVRGRARRMARCVVQPLGRPVWLCVEEENIEIKRQEPTHLGKLYELPTPVPIRAGETIGYLGMYEAPTSTEGGMSSKHMVHLELFSDDPRAEAVVSSKEWKDKGFTLIDGSDSDGALDPAKIPPFFLHLYRHASDDKELKDDELTVKKLENAVDSIGNYDRVKGMVVKHRSEWWTPDSKVMMERFKSIFSEVAELPVLIYHEVERAEKLGWMDKLSKVHIAGPKVLHFYPLSLLLSKTERFIFSYTNYNYSLDKMIDIQMGLGVRGGPTIQRGRGFPRISRAEAEPYIDPMRHMSENDLYQYLDISKIIDVTPQQLDLYLTGRGVLHGMGNVFYNAGKSYGINAIYLAVHASLETERGTSQLATGQFVNGDTVYNMYGIGAIDGMAVEAGKRKAYELGWNTPEKAIDGGAKWIASKFIKSKQNTLYKMRWNPDSPGTHQYATAANWALVQASSLKKEFDKFPNVTVPLDIPVYNG